jgi:hypothetical protein
MWKTPTDVQAPVEPSGMQFAILCKEVSTFEASRTLVAIIIATLLVLDYRCHSYLPTEAPIM